MVPFKVGDMRAQSQALQFFIEQGANVADIDLTQLEADNLIAMEKHRITDDDWNFPNPGDRLTIPLQSADRRESFTLDVTRGAVKLTKGTFQNRARQAIVLLRLDIEGAPHRNPDGVDIPCPHLHIYKEGYGDKWAITAQDLVSNDGSLFSSLTLFMERCNITQPPRVHGGLF